MNILSLLSFSNFLYFSTTAIYLAKVNFKSKLNQFSFLVSMSLGIWCFAYSFFYIAPSKEEAWFWHKVGSIGWCSFTSFTAYFFLVLTRLEHKINTKLKYMLFYSVPVILIFNNIISSTTPVAQDLILSNSGLGWTYVNRLNSIWLWIYLAYLGIYFSIALFLVYRWGEKSKYAAEKKQAKTFIIVDTIVIIFGLITDILMPLVSSYIPPLANIGTVVFIFGFWFIIKKYNVLYVSNIASAKVILDTIMDPVILLDDQGRIVKCNLATKEFLGYSIEDIINKELKFILADNDYNKSRLENLFSNKSLRNQEIDLITADSRIVNAIYSASLAEDEIHGFLGVVISFHDITKRKVMEQELRESKDKYKNLADELYKMANYDVLTNLPNRRLFFEKLEQMQKKSRQANQKLALIFLDLDGFKKINDQYGHDIGDELLVETTKRLKRCIFGDDLLARIGGDEFVMIINNISSMEAVIKRKEFIKQQFDQPIHIRGVVCPIGISAGFSIYPNDSSNINELLRKADQTMYIDKGKK